MRESACGALSMLIPASMETWGFWREPTLTNLPLRECVEQFAESQELVWRY